MAPVKPFSGFFGNTATLRTIEFLLPHENLEFNVSELAEFVGVARQTMSRIVKDLTDHGLLVSTSRTRNSTNYKINAESPYFKPLIEISNRLIESFLDEETLYEIGDYWASKPQPPVKRELKPKTDIKPDFTVVEPEPKEQELVFPWQRHHPSPFLDTGIVHTLGAAT